MTLLISLDRTFLTLFFLKLHISNGAGHKFPNIEFWYIFCNREYLSKLADEKAANYEVLLYYLLDCLNHQNQLSFYFN